MHAAPSSHVQENHAISSELAELRILSGRLESEAKDAHINVDTYKDKVNDLQRDIEEQQAMIEELRKAERKEKEEEKERRKEIMLSEMMAKIDMVSWVFHCGGTRSRS